MTFTLTPFRSYLIQRPKDKSDPDPKFGTVIFHIWPLMLLATLAHLSLLTCVAGLIGPYIFPALVIRFFVNLAVLLLNSGIFCTRKENRRENIELQPDIERNKTTADEERQQLCPDMEHNRSHARTQSDELTDILLAALCSIWLPSVVGDQKKKIFLVSGMTSLVTKVLLLAIAVALAAFGLQHQIYKRPFLLYCVDENSSLLAEQGVRPCTGSNCFANNKTLAYEIRLGDALEQLTDAVLTYQNVVSDIKRDIQSSEQGKVHVFFQTKLFDASGFLDQIKQTKAKLDDLLTSTGAGHIQQKLRVCQEGEGLFRIGLLVGLLVVTALAAYSTYRLHRIADYRVF